MTSVCASTASRLAQLIRVRETTSRLTKSQWLTLWVHNWRCSRPCPMRWFGSLRSSFLLRILREIRLSNFLWSHSSAALCSRLLELDHGMIAANSELCMQYRIKARTETCTWAFHHLGWNKLYRRLPWWPVCTVYGPWVVDEQTSILGLTGRMLISHPCYTQEKPSFSSTSSLKVRNAAALSRLLHLGQDLAPL